MYHMNPVLTPLIPQLNKQQMIHRDIICRYLDEYKGREQELIDNWQHFNTEHLTEVAMARVGGYEFIDENHYDNSDYSDTKTTSIARAINKRTNASSYRISIGNVVSKRGSVAKYGDLRVVMYNPCWDRLDYYFLPKAEWDPGLREYGDANKDKIRATYNPDLDHVLGWDPSWKCNSFEELASRTSTITNPQLWVPKPRNNFAALFAQEGDDDWEFITD